MSNRIDIDGPYFRQRSRAKRAALQLLLALVIGSTVCAVLGFSLGYFNPFGWFQ